MRHELHDEHTGPEAHFLEETKGAAAEALLQRRGILHSPESDAIRTQGIARSEEISGRPYYSKIPGIHF